MRCVYKCLQHLVQGVSDCVITQSTFHTMILMHTCYKSVFSTLYKHFFLVQSGASPLFFASQNNHGEVVTILLKAGAKLDLVRKVSGMNIQHETMYM